jgi:Sec-independent protein secretion pathway component TatC
MGSRLFPLVLALAASLADAGGHHQLAGLLVLLAIPCGAAAAFVAISDALEGRQALVRAGTSTLALLLFVIGSAVRHGAPAGAQVPAFAFSAVVAAGILYLVPVLLWVLQPAELLKDLGENRLPVFDDGHAV